MRRFYMKYFGMYSTPKYVNKKTRFTSYFLTFPEGNARIELMGSPHLEDGNKDVGCVKGLAHFAIALGSREAVDSLTEQLRSDGYMVVGEPRVTGDGYYESVVSDPEGNRIELTV